MSEGLGRVGSPPVDASPPVALAALAGDAEIRGDRATPITGVAYDSRDVSAGSLFFCIAGSAADGHDHAVEAAAAGAVAAVVERWLDDVALPQLRVPSVRAAMGPMSSIVFGDPAGRLVTVGVTGTNGKTTMTYLLEQVFREAGLRPGVIGTTGARMDGEPVRLARTTPEAPDLHRLLATMAAGGIGAVAMEISSHALAQGRVGGLVVDIAAFTNLSHDHLDYHRSMEDYFAAKARLFTPAHARRGVVCVDDDWGRRLTSEATIPVSTIAIDGDADLRATDVTADRDGITFRVDDTVVRSALRGRFNAANCLGAFAVGRRLGFDDGILARAIAAVPGVPGRMEPVDAGQDFLVVVDYAHTPDSILGVLRGARPLSAGRVIVVFGCGGDRDQTKRPRMGEVATTEADLTVITTDNPRSEDARSIIDQIVPGAVAGGGRFVVEPDRQRAIALAVGEAGAGDVVVIAGKGHERTQELGDEIVPFDDREVAREALTARGT